MPTRRQRKQAQEADTIPLAHPPQNSKSHGNRAKSLYEIAAERQAQLLQSQSSHEGPPNNALNPTKVEYVTVNPDGEITSNPPDIGAESEEPAALPPLADTIFVSLSLSFVHFTLSFLAAHQYAQDTEIIKLLRDVVLVAFPTLTLLVHFSHGHIISFSALRMPWRGGKANANNNNKLSNSVPGQTQRKSLILLLFPLTPRNIIFLPIASLLGTKLIAMANEASYYAVMKHLPAIGTLWVWAVLEMSAGGAILGLLVPVIWSRWWKGYSLL
ncbi:hypothetical protein FQN57_004271 [Myotisia sp. PD_48]|nr:hypothetical protein FQN57_004271 [Myotisia sp. PD_48]